LRRRLQVSGHRLQGCGYEMDVALAGTRSNVEASPANPRVCVSAEANGLEDLRSET
jgi:hypothetical protein